MIRKVISVISKIEEKIAILAQYQKEEFQGNMDRKVVVAVADFRQTVISKVGLLSDKTIKKFEKQFKKITGLDFKYSD